MTRTLPAAQLGNQPGNALYFPMQQALPLLARLDGPSVAHPQAVDQLQSYRDACRYCFMHRRVTGMTLKAVAEYAGIPPQHIGEYLSDDDTRREMPAKYIKAFESVCGNTAVSQFIARQASLTVMEEVQAATRRAA